MSKRMAAAEAEGTVVVAEAILVVAGEAILAVAAGEAANIFMAAVAAD